jgi:hypothetical protein
MKIFDFDARKGSLISSTHSFVNLGAAFVRRNKGKMIDSKEQTGIIETTTNVDLSGIGTGDYSITMSANFIKFRNIGSVNNCFFAIDNTASGGFGISLTTTEIFTLVTTSSVALGNIPKGDFNLTIVRKSGILKVYLNGLIIYDLANTAVINQVGILRILRDTVSSRVLYGGVYELSIYNRALSDIERNKIYQDFLQSGITEKPTRFFEYPKPTDLSHERNTEFTGDEYVQVMEFTDNSGTTSNLRLNDGGDFAVVDWTGNSDFQEISTSTETESNVIPSTVKIFAKNGELTYFRSTDNEYDFDIANLPSGMTSYYNSGSNTTSGDIANLPSGMTSYINFGSNTTSGDIANLPSGMTSYYNTGSNTTSGDIANLPSGMTSYYNTGSNTTSGDIANLPSGMTSYINFGSNTTSGDIANLPSEMTDYFNTGSNQVNTYTSGRTWANNMRRIYHRPASGYGLSVTHISDLLIDLSNVSTWTFDKEIDLLGNNSSMSDTVQGGIWGSYDSGDNPSDLAIALKTLVNTKGVTVDLNDITIPDVSGDGTGFPTGFGDWWRS